MKTLHIQRAKSFGASEFAVAAVRSFVRLFVFLFCFEFLELLPDSVIVCPLFLILSSQSLRIEAGMKGETKIFPRTKHHTLRSFA